MKLPLKIGLPLLALLLVGLAFTDGPAQQLLLFAAMGVALWSAFSLPRPAPPPEAPLLRPVPGEFDEDDGADDRVEENPEAEPRTPPIEGPERGGGTGAT
ncbi:MAG TPA: hypothetical protein VKB51_01305 [bacterium]|nr:hypothetical protein [bacterium]